MNEFNVLLGAATNGTPSGSLFDALFARYIAPQESWRELESPLPITILSAGEDLIDYRIYGNTESGESVGERTENLFDKNATDPNNGYMSSTLMYADGSMTSNAGYKVSEYISVASNTDYYLTSVNGEGTYPSVCFYDESKDYISGISYNRKQSLGITTPNGTAYLRMVTAKYVTDASMLTEGSTAPTSYIPYGYKLPMMVQSENLFDSDACDTSKGYVKNAYLDVRGDIVQYSQFMISEYLPVQATSTYLFTGNNYNSAGTCIVVYNTNKDVIAAVKIDRRDIVPVYTPVNAAFVRLSFSLVPMDTKKFVCVKEKNVYIGENQLTENEYVSFSEQKIYRIKGGTLTPTDPPVPLPALPTIEGETIIDYNPSETPAVEPEKMYVKYKP